jgi:hypothetical protein
LLTHESSRSLAFFCFVVWLSILPAACTAQASDQAAIPPLPAFPVDPASSIAIHREVLPQLPFSVVGPRGAILGQQDGTFEVWLFPWKILSGMRITVDMQDYAVPIDVNQHAAGISVQPDATTITYSHANFTIRQTMIA